MKKKSSKNKPSDSKTLKWLTNIFKKQIPMLILLIVLNTFYGVTSVFYANFSKHIIDGATLSKSENAVIKYAVAMLLLVIFQLVLNIVKNCLAERCNARLDIVMKRYMLDTIMKKDYQSVSAYHTGELQNRLFNDVTVVTEGFTNILPQAFYWGSKLVSSLIYLIVLDKIFAVVFVIGGCCIFLITRLFRKTLKRLHKKVQETEGKTRSFMQEAIINLLVVKAFAAEDKIDSHSDILQEENFAARIKKRNFSIIANTGLGALFSIGTVFAVAFGAWSILNNGMSYGTVTAIIQLVNQVQSPFASLSSIMPRYFSLVASAERLMEIDSLPDEEGENEDEIDIEDVYKNLCALNIDNVSFKFDRDMILDRTSLSIKKGDFVAVTGISGIGKSTLLKLLLGVFKAQEGSISLMLSNGSIPVDKYTRRLFSYVPQGNMLISGTIRDNLLFINENASEREIEEAVRVSCSKQFIDELPQGLDTVIGEKGLGLSEGQVQRLAIARSLLSKSPILLLDEATSALDEETEKRFLTNLKSLDNVTCIIVSHKKAALEICNKRIQIINGKILSYEG